MSSDAEDDDERVGTVGRDQFTTTHWSVVLQAGHGDSSQAAAALEQLCRTYWYPLYVYARRRGHGHEDAEDLIQGFFLQLLQHRSFADVSPNKGQFRSFLLAGLKYYLADSWDKAQAEKRGGGLPTLMCDMSGAELRYAKESCDDLRPDKIYERQWAVTLLGQVLARLERHYDETGRGELFVKLKSFLVEGGRGRPYAEVGAELGLSEEAVKKAVQRLRQRYGALFREEIAQTLANPAEVDEELRYLNAIMTR
jgi:RNA polymerase sigma factor (sigma-70 family)